MFSNETIWLKYTSLKCLPFSYLSDVLITDVLMNIMSYLGFSKIMLLQFYFLSINMILVYKFYRYWRRLLVRNSYNQEGHSNVTNKNDNDDVVDFNQTIPSQENRLIYLHLSFILKY